MLLKLAKLLVGLLLIPVCIAITRTIGSLIQAIPSSPEVFIPTPAIALAGGLGLWLLLYMVLPRPARTYVLAHELTHALWGSLMGARVVDMKISKETGSVTLSKTNFLITLAPYFFPLYTVLVIAAYYLLSMFMDVATYYLWWLGLVGLSWGFHFTFTLNTLLQRQTDIRDNGHLFSYTVIYAMNALGIALWIVLVSSATLGQLFDFLVADLKASALLVWIWLVHLRDLMGAARQ
jgi:hypothetical protein